MCTRVLVCADGELVDNFESKDLSIPFYPQVRNVM